MTKVLIPPSELEEQLILQVIKASISVSDYRKDENVLLDLNLISNHFSIDQDKVPHMRTKVLLNLTWTEINQYQYLCISIDLTTEVRRKFFTFRVD